jgi:hypothetical protein
VFHHPTLEEEIEIMTERENDETDAGVSAFEGPAAPPAKGGGQSVEDVDVEFVEDNDSSTSAGLDDGDEGASPPPPRGGGGN